METKPQGKPRILLMMGSQSDLGHLEPGLAVLEELEIPFEVRVASAHRTPERVTELATQAAQRGIEVIVAAAGASAHLAGVLAAQTALPVVGIPVASTSLGGFDALLSMAQMPRGVPVGVMAVGGAANGALFAARILALSDDGVRDRLRTWQQKLRARVEDGDRKVQQRYPSG